MNNDWFFHATFTNGTAMTFYAENKTLARDHADAVAHSVNTTTQRVTRLKHSKDVTPEENAAAGILWQA